MHHQTIIPVLENNMMKLFLLASIFFRCVSGFSLSMNASERTYIMVRMKKGRKSIMKRKYKQSPLTSPHLNTTHLFFQIPFFFHSLCMKDQTRWSSGRFVFVYMSISIVCIRCFRLAARNELKHHLPTKKMDSGERLV